MMIGEMMTVLRAMVIFLLLFWLILLLDCNTAVCTVLCDNALIYAFKVKKVILIEKYHSTNNLVIIY